MCKTLRLWQISALNNIFFAFTWVQRKGCLAKYLKMGHTLNLLLSSALLSYMARTLVTQLKYSLMMVFTSLCTVQVLPHACLNFLEWKSSNFLRKHVLLVPLSTIGIWITSDKCCIWVKLKIMKQKCDNMVMKHEKMNFPFDTPASFFPMRATMAHIEQ